jgi:hypothetical protein
MCIAGEWSAYPLKSKAPAETLQALHRAFTVLGGPPKVLETDEGGEFHGPVQGYLNEHGVTHIQETHGTQTRWPWSIPLIGRVRRAMAREMVETGSESWVAAFRKAQDAMNRRPLDHLLGARPVDVEDNHGAPVQPELPGGQAGARAHKPAADAGAEAQGSGGVPNPAAPREVRQEWQAQMVARSARC